MGDSRAAVRVTQAQLKTLNRRYDAAFADGVSIRPLVEFIARREVRREREKAPL